MATSRFSDRDVEVLITGWHNERLCETIAALSYSDVVLLYLSLTSQIISCKCSFANSFTNYAAGKARLWASL